MYDIKEIETAVEELKAAGLEEFLIQEPTAGPLSRRSGSACGGSPRRGGNEGDTSANVAILVVKGVDERVGAVPFGLRGPGVDDKPGKEAADGRGEEKEP